MKKSSVQIDTRRLISIVIRTAVQFLISFGIWAALLFFSAGTFLWFRGWIHLGLWIVTLSAGMVILLAVNPSIIENRTRRQRFGSRFDFFLMVFIMLPAMLAIPVVAGLDAVRYENTLIPFWAVYPAFVLHCIGNAIMVWAMAVNPYLEKTVRIQSERDHHVIETGPYAFIRHPMYAGFIFLLPGILLTLGSLWAFVPACIVVIVMIIRTVFEDRFLQDNLPGYKQYSQKTKYLIFPKIW